MKKSESNLKNDNVAFDDPDYLKDIKLFSRSETSKILSIGISHLDKLPESKLKKTRIGRSVRYSLESIKEFIYLSTEGEKNDKK